MTYDDTPQPLQIDLIQWFNQLDQHLNGYALLDLAAVQRSDAERTLKKVRSMQGISILNDGREEAASAIPWLIPLAPDGARQLLLEQTLDWSHRGPCVTWLSSGLELHDLAQRLQRRSQAELPEAYPILLRYFDPRVLPELHTVLHGTEAAAGFWSVGQDWVYPGRDQRHYRIPLSVAPQVDLFEEPLQLSTPQFQALMTASEADQVMPELAVEAAMPFMAMPADQRFPFTRRCLKLADAWHVESFAQRVMVCVLALKLGEDFHQQASWAPWIRQLREKRINLIQAIEGATNS